MFLLRKEPNNNIKTFNALTRTIHNALISPGIITYTCAYSDNAVSFILRSRTRQIGGEQSFYYHFLIHLL